MRLGLLAYDRDDVCELALPRAEVDLAGIVAPLPARAGAEDEPRPAAEQRHEREDRERGNRAGIPELIVAAAVELLRQRRRAVTKGVEQQLALTVGRERLTAQAKTAGRIDGFVCFGLPATGRGVLEIEQPHRCRILALERPGGLSKRALICDRARGPRLQELLAPGQEVTAQTGLLVQHRGHEAVGDLGPRGGTYGGVTFPRGGEVQRDAEGSEKGPQEQERVVADRLHRRATCGGACACRSGPRRKRPG